MRWKNEGRRDGREKEEQVQRKGLSMVAWHMPLIVLLRRQRQEDHCELEASLDYGVSSRTGLHREILR